MAKASASYVVETQAIVGLRFYVSGTLQRSRSGGKQSILKVLVPILGNKENSLLQEETVTIKSYLPFRTLYELDQRVYSEIYGPRTLLDFFTSW